jgi:hypothetical protein
MARKNDEVEMAEVKEAVNEKPVEDAQASVQLVTPEQLLHLKLDSILEELGLIKLALSE